MLGAEENDGFVQYAEAALSVAARLDPPPTLQFLHFPVVNFDVPPYKTLVETVGTLSEICMAVRLADLHLPVQLAFVEGATEGGWGVRPGR